MNKGISVVGVPMWLGQTRYGANLGPDAIRAAGLLECLKDLDQDVIDLGNIAVSTAGKFKPVEDRMKNLKPIIAASKKLMDKVSGIVAQNRFPLILGGDHSIAIGVLAGISKYFRNLGIIWYDAHADINTPETTPSGNIHGMPLAASMGLGHPALVNIGGYAPKIRPENIVLLGVRDIDPGEQRLIAEKQIKVYTMDDVREMGMTRVMQETIEYLAQRCDGVHLSFDLDGLDPQEAPGVGTPVPEGISYNDSVTAVKLLFEANIITSADFVEVNPLLDKDNQTALTAVSLINILFGSVAASEGLAATSEFSQQYSSNGGKA